MKRLMKRLKFWMVWGVNLRILVGIMILVANISLAFAEEEQKEIFLEEIVVTATKTERSLEEVPGRIQVITKEDIKKISAQKVDDILKTISGLNVVRRAGIYSITTEATLRGLSNEQSRTLILIDGIPINKTDTGGVNWNRINIEDIERIEIFKGPASSLYGNNAMGGVINIITKKPVKRLEGNVTGRYGSFDTYGGNFAISAKPSEKLTGLYFRLSGLYQDSDGYISRPEERRTQYTVKRFAEEGSVGLKLGYGFDKLNSLELNYNYYDDKRGEGEKIFAPDGVHRHFDTNFINLKYKGGTGEIKWDIQLFYQLENYRRVSERIRRGEYTRFDVDSDREDMGLLFNISKPLFSGNLLTGGIDIKEGRVDAIDEYKTSPDRTINRGKMRFYGLYLQNEIDLFNGALKTIVGIRYDYAKFFDGFYHSTLPAFAPFNRELEENSWSAITPRFSGRYFFSENLSGYISYGRGFRSSILDDLCRSGILWGIYKEANPDLKPEKIDNFELGMDLEPNKRLKISPTLFYSIGRDFLYFVDTGRTHEGRPLYRRENVGKVMVYGGEFDLGYSFNKNISIFANYTYNRSKIEEFEKMRHLEGEDLTRTPRHVAKLGINWLNPYLNMSAIYFYKGSQFVYTNEVRQTVKKIDGFSTVDLKLWRDIGKNFSFAFTIDNLFNRRYMESDEEMAPGRFIVAEATLKF